jgi:5-formyltetrahydrofolate cyclo-ligase
MTLLTHDKSALRAELRRRRRVFVEGLPPSVRRLAFRALPSPLAARLPGGATVALYRPVGAEAPTDALADALDARGHPLCLPRLRSTDGDMDFAAWHPNDVLVPGLLRVPEPQRDRPVVVPDIIIAPLLGFDRRCQRLGQGGGYYDRAFAAQPQALRVGLAWSAQEVDAVPVEAWDMPLDIILTECELIERETKR